MTDHRTTATIDYDHYRHQGRALRNEALQSLGAAFRRRLTSLAARRPADRIHAKLAPRAKA